MSRAKLPPRLDDDLGVTLGIGEVGKRRMLRRKCIGRFEQQHLAHVPATITSSRTL
jgi:hypothetical protein